MPMMTRAPNGIQLLPQPNGIRPLPQPHGIQPLPQTRGIQRQEQLHGIQHLPQPRQSQPACAPMTGLSHWRDVSSSSTQVGWEVSQECSDGVLLF